MQSITDQFREWLNTKRADEEYDYVDSGNCAFCQFLRDTGLAKNPRVSPGRWRDGDQSVVAHDMPDLVQAALNGFIGGEYDCPRTFGALADRLSSIDAKVSAE